MRPLRGFLPGFIVRLAGHSGISAVIFPAELLIAMPGSALPGHGSSSYYSRLAARPQWGQGAELFYDFSHDYLNPNFVYLVISSFGSQESLVLSPRGNLISIYCDDLSRV